MYSIQIASHNGYTRKKKLKTLIELISLTKKTSRNPQHKNCPKCRRDITESSLIKLYFGKSSNSDEQQELNQEITDLLDETELCKNRIQILMQEVNKDVSNTLF